MHIQGTDREEFRLLLYYNRLFSTNALLQSNNKIIFKDSTPRQVLIVISCEMTIRRKIAPVKKSHA